MDVAVENKSFEEDIISKLPIDSTFLNQHHYDRVNVKNSTDFHIGPKIEVHIDHKKIKSSGVLKDLIPQLKEVDPYKKCKATGIVCVALILIIGIIATAIYSLNVNADSEADNEITTYNYTDSNSTSNNWNVLKFVNRTEWLAEPPRNKPNKIKQPVPQVVITHTASESCYTRPKCKFLVRQIQTFHVEGENWDDIGYNFLVGGDGYVYEGRGWDSVGAFARGFNNISIGIAMIGTFISQTPTEKQLNAGKSLINEGVNLKKLSENYRLIPHCNVSETASPGLMLYEILKTWPHFTEYPY